MRSSRLHIMCRTFYRCLPVDHHIIMGAKWPPSTLIISPFRSYFWPLATKNCSERRHMRPPTLAVQAGWGIENPVAITAAVSLKGDPAHRLIPGNIYSQGGQGNHGSRGAGPLRGQTAPRRGQPRDGDPSTAPRTQVVDTHNNIPVGGGSVPRWPVAQDAGTDPTPRALPTSPLIRQVGWRPVVRLLTAAGQLTKLARAGLMDLTSGSLIQVFGSPTAGKITPVGVEVTQLTGIPHKASTVRFSSASSRPELKNFTTIDSMTTNGGANLGLNATTNNHDHFVDDHFVEYILSCPRGKTQNTESTDVNANAAKLPVSALILGSLKAQNSGPSTNLKIEGA